MFWHPLDGFANGDIWKRDSSDAPDRCQLCGFFRKLFQEAVPGLSWWSQGLGHGLSTEHTLPWSMAISLVCFYHLHLFGTLTFLPHSISQCGILLSWVAALGAGAFCVLLYPLGLMGSTSTCAQGTSWAVVQVCVTSALKHTPAHSLEGCIVFTDLLQQSGREEAKFRDMNILVIADME